MGLGQLGADRAATDDDQVAGPRPVLENRLVGQVGHVVEAGDRWRGGRRAGGDDEPPGANDKVADSDFAASGERRPRLHHPDAEAFEAIDGIDRRDRGDDAVDVVVDALEIDCGLDGGDTEAVCPAHGIGGVGGGDHRYRWHAAIIEAVAAHLAGLDQHRGGAELGGASGDGQAARPAANDTDIGLDRFGHYLRRRRLYRSGASDSTARPISGHRISGWKMTPRSGSWPASSTAPRPLPTLTKTTVPGMMPMKVATI